MMIDVDTLIHKLNNSTNEAIISIDEGDSHKDIIDKTLTAYRKIMFETIRECPTAKLPDIKVVTRDCGEYDYGYDCGYNDAIRDCEYNIRKAVQNDSIRNA